MKRYYEAGGVQISEEAMKKEFATRPTFNLSQQTAMFNRGTKPASDADNAMTAIAFFLRTVGSLRPDEQIPDPKTYVTDEFLKIIDSDAELKGFLRRAF